MKLTFTNSHSRDSYSVLASAPTIIYDTLQDGQGNTLAELGETFWTTPDGREWTDIAIDGPSGKSLSRAIALKFIERAEHAIVGRGAKNARNRAALEYVIGASTALELAGIEDNGVRMFAFLIATRGYSAVEELAKGPA